ncbi:MAG: M81 family metallopeptidase [Silicimonas sp.]|nr:M81 family metallopeptidase [Silicimonas sp.]
MRLALAGFQHETNSFAPTRAGMAEFEMADSWPGLLTGEDVIPGTRGLNLPIVGAAEAAAAAHGELVPILWAAAEPSGPVMDEVFETITERLIATLRNRPVDGLYLDLHGAMITESHDDGEGALLARLRHAFGPDLPIAISLDMHANLTPKMVELADAITIYRTYPHLDMAETGARAMAALIGILRGHRPAMAFRQIPYLIPMHAQHTGGGAMGRLTRAATEAGAELAVGFTAGDMVDCGPAILAQATTETEADTIADTLLTRALEEEQRFDTALPNPADAVRHAMAAPPGKPVVIADVQDNPGGGASSDTTGVLHALAEARAKGTLLGLFHDPEATAMAHDLGIGARFETALGGRSGVAGDLPFAGQFEVAGLADGRVTYEGEMYGGGIAQIGPSACLRLLSPGCDIRIVTSTIRNQCLDRGFFRHIGLTPEAARLIVVKSTVHYRADFDPIASEVISTGAPGLLGCDLPAIPYKNLRRGVRLGPKGPEFQGKSAQDSG